MKLLDRFIQTDSNPSLDFHMQTSKTVIGEYETLRADFSLSFEKDPNLYAEEELDVIKFLLTHLRFILSRFGRMISMYEALHQKYSKEANEGQKLLKRSSDISAMIEKDFRSQKKTKEYILSLREPNHESSKEPPSVKTVLDTLSEQVKT